MAFLFLYIDKQVDFKFLRILTIVFPENESSARSVLSVIAAAMVGVAGTVFSITLVVLTLAASQFGPRLLRNFMYVTLNQIVLGLYVATFLYSLIILNAVEGAEGYKFIPKLSVFVALLLTFTSLVFLILFIHRVSKSIQPSTIVAELRQELELNIGRIYPVSAGEDAHFYDDEMVQKIKEDFKYKKDITSNDSGYVEYIDIDKILSLAVNKNALYELHCKPGSYIVNNESMATIFYDEPDKSGELNEQKYFHLEISKTVFQDTEFAIHQIVEVASKALSPGINDPYTAIVCIDNLTSSLCTFTQIKFPQRYRVDASGALKLITMSGNFSGFINAAFNQIRQFGAAVPSVIIRLMESLITIKKFANQPEHFEIINIHANALLETASKNFTVKSDLEDLKERHNSLFNL